MIGRRTRYAEIHSTVFSARIEALEALQAAGLGSPDAAVRLTSAAANLRLGAEHFGDAPTAVIFSALADLVEMIGLLLKWRAAVLGAAADSQRFITAARERAAVWNEFLQI